MRHALILVVSLAMAGLSACAGSGERWTVTKYYVRSFKVPQQAAFEAGRKFFEQEGYKVTNEVAPELLHDSTQGRSLILRMRPSGASTEVEMKVGPAYDREQTRQMMDAYTKLLPVAGPPE